MTHETGKPSKTGNAYEPVLEVWRGPIVESLHLGAVAVVRSDGVLTHSYGDPQAVTYVRSAAKPFQLLPFVELGGPEHFQLTEQELAILGASHDGTDAHVTVLERIQAKTGITEADLKCGAHPPYHGPSEKALWLRGQSPSQNHHNCSGKHTMMLALAKMLGAPQENYLEIEHPVQQLILKTFSEMVSMPQEQVILGLDNCSAPVFAVPLYNAALGFARLVDPDCLPAKRAAACRQITKAMTNYPEMIAGRGTFDTTLMEISRGKLITKAGAEGFQGTGLFPETIPGVSKGFGLVVKIAEGDISGHFRENSESAEGRARPVVTIEALRQLEALSPGEIHSLTAFDRRVQYNWRKLEVGSFVPAFSLEKH